MNPMKKYQRITVVFLLLIGIVNYLDRSALSIANTSIQKDMMISRRRWASCCRRFPLPMPLPSCQWA